jgi:1-acyl-sn-glycerol-3-phosphate acyltransferase
MQIMMYIFVSRNRDKDIPRIIQQLFYLMHSSRRATLSSSLSSPTLMSAPPSPSNAQSDLIEPHRAAALSSRPGPSVFVFPEGTDLNPRSRERSNVCESNLSEHFNYRV